MKQSDSIASAVIERTSVAVDQQAGHDTALAARTRRSVRSYTGEPVDEETVTELLELTGRAPSAFNLQPWRFVVVRSAEVKAALGAAAYGQKQVTGAPVVLALYADMEDTLQHLDEIVHPDLPPQQRADTLAMLQRNFGGMTVEARGVWANSQANIALGYLLLLARAHGLDTSPMLGFEAPKVKQVLGIPEHATVTALVSLGHGAEPGFVSHRHAVERITRVL